MVVRVLVDSAIEANMSHWFPYYVMGAFKKNHWLGYYRYDDGDGTHFISVSQYGDDGYYLYQEQFSFIEDSPVIGRKVRIVEGQYKGKEGTIHEIFYNNKIFLIEFILHEIHAQGAFGPGEFIVID